MSELKSNNKKWIWYVALVIILIVIISSEEDVPVQTSSSTLSPYTNNGYTQNQNTYQSNQVEGYAWAEENDIDNFEECQNQFGTSYEEDECNRYVKENYTGYQNYNGYECTEDCSGHEAGYDWAEENEIEDEDDCGGNSDSFIEGCMSYVEDNY